MQERFAISFTDLGGAGDAALTLAVAAEAQLGGSDTIAGGCLLATAASGEQAHTVGLALEQRWPEAALVGTSFEGVIAEGRVWSGCPGLVLLAWTESERAPLPFVIEAEEPDLERLAEEILTTFPAAERSPRDLLLFFPDASMSPSLESRLPSLIDRIGPVTLAGAAASGPEGELAAAWVGDQASFGSCAGVFFPGPAACAGQELPRSIGIAGASRQATPWLEVTQSRPRWIDELEGRPALAALREELGLPRKDGLESVLDRLLVRFRPRKDEKGAWEERYIVGLDRRRNAFSLPIEIEQGGQISLAWPDAGEARNALSQTLAALAPAAYQLQFACRARDAALHGDVDLEPAWVASRAEEHSQTRAVVGTVAPFQLAAEAGTKLPVTAWRLVHSTVLVSVPSQ